MQGNRLFTLLGLFFILADRLHFIFPAGYRQVMLPSSNRASRLRQPKNLFSGKALKNRLLIGAK